MCAWLSAIVGVAGTGMSIAGSVEEGEAGERAARYRAGLSFERARRSDIAAWRMRDAGRVAAGMKEREGMSIEAAQLVGQAKGGSDTSYGTSALVRTRTDAFTDIDAELIKYNAELAAKEYERQAEEHRAAGRASTVVGESAQTASSLKAAGAGLGGLLHLSSLADRAGLFSQSGTTAARTGGTTIYKAGGGLGRVSFDFDDAVAEFFR